MPLRHGPFHNSFFNRVEYAGANTYGESFANAADVLARIADPAHWFADAPLVTLPVLLARADRWLSLYPGNAQEAVASEKECHTASHDLWPPPRTCRHGAL